MPPKTNHPPPKKGPGKPPKTNLLAYVIPSAKFTVRRTKEQFTIDEIYEFNHNFVYAKLSFDGCSVTSSNFSIRKSAANSLYLARGVDYRNQIDHEDQSLREITPIGDLCESLNLLLTKLSPSDFDKMFNERNFDFNGFSTIINSFLERSSFLLSTKKKQWLESFFQTQTPDDDHWDEINPDDCLRITVDSILNVNYCLLSDGTIALVNFVNGYPHVIHIKPGCISIYDGANFLNHNKMMCSGHNKHPLTMLIVLTTLIKKHPKLSDVIYCKFFATLNSDMNKHGFIKTLDLTLLSSMVDTFDLQICEASCRNCTIECWDVETFLVHLLYLNVLKCPPTETNFRYKSCIKYRDQIINVNFGVDKIDTDVIPEIKSEFFDNTKQELVELVDNEGILSTETINKFLNTSFQKFGCSFGMSGCSFEISDHDILNSLLQNANTREALSRNVKKMEASKSVYEFCNNLTNIFLVTFKYERTLNIDFSRWERPNIRRFIYLFYPLVNIQ